MTQIFLVENPDPDGLEPKLYANKDDANAIMRIRPGSFAFLDDNTDRAQPRVVVITLSKDGTRENTGWMEPGAFGAVPLSPTDLAALNHKFETRRFVRSCVRTELGFYSGGAEPSFAASAEFMLALASLESQLKNFDNQLGGLNAFGAFQITESQWDAFVAANPDLKLSIIDFYEYHWQIACVAFTLEKLHTDLVAGFSALPSADPQQPYVPSYLDLFHAWLLTPELAVALDGIHGSNHENDPIAPFLEEKTPDFQQDTRRVERIVKVSDSTLSFDGFFETTSKKLNTAFATALKLVKEHAPEYLRKPTGGAAPWMAIANREHKIWLDGGFTEAAQKGREKVIEYFKKGLNIDTDGSLAWCGAFASYCMRESGNAVAASSLVPVSERAANWKTWGQPIPLGEKPGNIPPGAVIVLKPAPGTNGSGHITFFKQPLATDSSKFECLGGNQGDRLRVSTYHRGRIVAIRWLGTATADPAQDGDKEFVLAQTIYGEARGESDEGRQAVGNVVMNRVAAGRSFYGSDVKSVCLKPWQFSCWNEIDPNRDKLLVPATWKTPEFKQCLDVAKNVIEDNLPDITGGATHYFKIGTETPSWVVTSTTINKTVEIGNHIFFKNVDG